jgi:hypothetical protein
VRDGEGSRANQLRDEASRLIDILEMLGWDHADGRDSHEIRMEPWFRRWLNDKRSEIEAVLGANVVTLAHKSGARTITSTATARRRNPSP